MPVPAATFGQTNMNTAAGATQYKSQLDSDTVVLTRLGDIFAPHQGSTADMRVYLDPGFILSGTSLTEVGTYTTATGGSGGTSLTVASATGISGTMWITGAGIPNGTTCTISGTTLTLSQATTAALSATPVVLGQRSSAITAPVTNPRIDRIVVNASTGAVSIIAGAENATPTPPALTAGVLPVAQVKLLTSSTSILNTMITDERATGSGGGSNDTEATVASATTTDIGATNVNAILITGTTTITSFGSNGSTTQPYYDVRFNGALLLTYNGTSLTLPGKVNITTIAGDRARFQYMGSGNWQCVYYSRASGAPVIEGPTATVASATTTDIGTSGVTTVTISGTTTITSLGSTATTDNPLYFLTFSGALTLTYNASSLILPGVANITTAANDTAIAQYLGSGNWQILNYCKANGASISGSGNGGATTGSAGSNLVLTASSNRYQVWTATAAGLSAQLPDATTLASAGGVIFCIKNGGTFSFSVIDNAGNVIWILGAGESVMLWCSNTASAAGKWASGQIGGLVSDLFEPNCGSAQVLSSAGASGSNSPCITPLTTTTAFIAFNDQTATAAVKAAVLTITGESISIGTIATLEAIASVSYVTCCALDSTHVLVAYATSTTSKIQVASVSGTTVTSNSGTAAVIEAAVITNPQLFFISSTSAYLSYAKATGTKSAGVVITTSSVTPTVNAITYGVATIASALGNIAVCQISATAYFYAYAGTSAFLGAQIFTVSGTAVTANAGITNQSNSVACTFLSCVSFGSGMVAVLLYESANGVSILFSFTVSGTTILLGSAVGIAIQQPGTAMTPITVNLINNSSGVCTISQTLNGQAKITQAPFKIDPTNGDIIIEPTLTLSTNQMTLGGGNAMLSGFPLVGAISTLTGKLGISYLDKTASKPAVIYMNTVTP